MAAAKQCDKCGEFYVQEKLDLKKKYEDGRPIIRVEIHSFGLFDTLDLCPKCGELFRDWFGRDKTCLK